MASFSSETALDELLRQYEDDFYLREPFVATRYMGDESEKDIFFVGGILESLKIGYKSVTNGKLKQFSEVPPNVQIQLPPGQPMPIVQGLPRKLSMDLLKTGWYKNKKKDGVTK